MYDCAGRGSNTSCGNRCVSGTIYRRSVRIMFQLLQDLASQQHDMVVLLQDYSAAVLICCIVALAGLVVYLCCRHASPMACGCYLCMYSYIFELFARVRQGELFILLMRTMITTGELCLGWQHSSRTGSPEYHTLLLRSGLQWSIGTF